jgi:hypothetical protein
MVVNQIHDPKICSRLTISGANGFGVAGSGHVYMSDRGERLKSLGT